MSILVAGSSGMVGSAILRKFEEFDQKVTPMSRRDVDFEDETSTLKYIDLIQPESMVIAAAKVGGISANQNSPVEFLETNLRIQNSLIRAAFKVGIPRLVFLGSSCIYPRSCPQPIKEESLMTGLLEATNSAYAISKIAGIELINSYRKEYGLNWISLMPTNLYGPGDNFNLQSAHVMPSFIRRFTEAVDGHTKTLTLWGTGSPRREFLHVDDLANAVFTCLQKYNDPLHLNVGTGEDLTIHELATKVSKATGFEGQIEWDSSKPDGTPRKVLDVTRISKLGWRPTISLDEGIASTIAWYRDASARGEVRK
jgi:GDP-L-fucose synthase